MTEPSEGPAVTPSTLSPTAPSARGCLQTILLTLGGLGIVALGIARLARVPRTRFESVQTFHDGSIALGHVLLERRGAVGRTIGWAVVCNQREVFSMPGTTPPEVQSSGEGVCVRDPVRNNHVWIHAVGCTVTSAN